MEGKYLGNCLSIEANDDETYKEKTRIAEVAAATLCRLNSIMKQMKDWRDERVKLTSNIWRLRLALRVASKETEDTLHADPLIEHQRAEIKRLEVANQTLKKEIADIKAAILDGGYVAQDTSWKHDDKLLEVRQEYLVEKEHLNNEIQYLKSRLNETEEGHEHSSEVEHLKCKLKHFMMVDHTMEIVFTDIVNRVAETIANLSEELVNVNECLHRSRLRNNTLYITIDKLKAMHRSKNGNLVDYQKRIVELENLTKRMKTELNKLGVNHSKSSSNRSTNYQESLRNVELLTNELRNKLMNDREALLAAGDPDCVKYMQKIIELRDHLKQVHVDLVKFNDPRDSCPKKVVEHNIKQFTLLGSALTQINIELDELKNDYVKRHSKIGGKEGVEYLKKIEELVSMIEKARVTTNRLNNHRMEGNSCESGEMEKLGSFVDSVCREMKQLEVIVTSGDRWNMLKRIEQLEEVIVRLKAESKEKERHVNILSEELFDMKSLLEQRNRELKGEQGKVASLLDEYKALKGRTKRMEERTSEIQREQEGSRKELEQLQQVRREATTAKKNVQNLQADKEALLKEMGKIRDTLQKKNEEMKAVVSEKDTAEKTFHAKTIDLIKNVQTVSKENEKLRNKINEFERAKCKDRETVASLEKKNEDAKRWREMSKNASAEAERLRTNLAVSKEELENANREINDMKVKLEHLTGDNKKMAENVCHLESKKEILAYQLGAEKTTAEERLKELIKLKTTCKELNVEVVNLRNENEQLSVVLTNSKIEKKSIEESVEHVRSKCSKLENEIEKYKLEYDNLQERIRNYQTSERNFTNKLEEARSELNGTGDKITQLEFENSKLHNDLNGLTLKNAGLEDHVQVLLSEKNDLATCINELQQENALLRDQLNEVKTVNEYSTVELNKLRTEGDKARSENTLLQTALDETRKRNGALKETCEELKLRLAEIHSEYRILKNQLKIFELTNVTLQREKDTLEHEYVNNLRFKVLQMEKNGCMVYDKEYTDKQDKQIVKPLINKATIETKRGNVKSNKRTKCKTETSESKMGTKKKLTVENESLKFEILNLRSQNFEMKMELTRLKKELQRHGIEVSDNELDDGKIVTSTSNKLEIVNLYYKEINNYSDQINTVACVDQSSVCPYNLYSDEQEAGTGIPRLMGLISKLKVENIALKMEVNALRCNLVVNFVEDEKRRNELRDTTEEIGALKMELTRLREERESLRTRLDIVGMKLSQLESEKSALKDELYSFRKINSDFKHKVNELRCDYQKLKEKSGEFESCIMRAIKKVGKHTTSTGDQESPNNELKNLLKRYISDENVLCSIEREINVKGT